MTRTVPSATPTLPPIALTPEQAAAVAVALAAQPEGPYAADGRAALEAVLAALEPDPLRRAALAARTRRVQAAARGADRPQVGDARTTTPPAPRGGPADAEPRRRWPHPTHPAGRARKPAAAPVPPAAPRLVLLPGGRRG